MLFFLNIFLSIQNQILKVETIFVASLIQSLLASAVKKINQSSKKRNKKRQYAMHYSFFPV